MKRIILIGLMLCAFVLGLSAQQATYSFFNTGYGSAYVSDTTTNTGTGSIKTARVGGGNHSYTTVQVVITKISGTVAGTSTIILLGSVDGTNYKAATLADASTALHTFTATDVASQNFIWRLTGNPYPYYKIEYTGTGTMAASLSGKLSTR